MTLETTIMNETKRISRLPILHHLNSLRIWRVFAQAEGFREKAGFVLSTGLGTGFIGHDGRGGGTSTSIVTALTLIALNTLTVNTLDAMIYVLLAALVTLIYGPKLCEAGEDAMRRYAPEWMRHTGLMVKYDFNQTTLDEVHGMLIAAIPFFATQWVITYMTSAECPFNVLLTSIGIGIACLVFRIFDGKKIGWVRWAEERWEGGKGIMYDDSFAGLQAAVMMPPVVLTLVILALRPFDPLEVLGLAVMNIAFLNVGVHIFRRE